jgi:ADP-heptose:LPS heptosyltransferase
VSLSPSTSEELDGLIHRALDPDSSVALPASRTFFREVIERDCDLFEPAATQSYAELFASVVARVLPGYDAAALIERYRRVRNVRRYHGRPRRVCVLSRVTLGADVAVTSVLLEAAKQRFPNGEICLVGPDKNLELFAGDSRIVSLSIKYGRSSCLRDRVLASESVREVVDREDTIVIDPDSRLTQLGIIPVCEEENYLFFESRAYEPASGLPLSALAAQWARETLGTPESRPYLHPLPPTAGPKAITVSLGVGENEEKRIGDDFERQAVSKLVSFGHPVLIDEGAGGEESVRVRNLAVALGCPENLRLHQGSFAAFASHILESRLYFGYDSAGQHVAAAGGVPLVTVFAGYACERTFDRWRPTSTGPIHVIKAGDDDSARVTKETLAALTSAAVEAGLS